MGSLTMTPDEYAYYVDNLREAFDLIGQKAYLFEVDEEVKDIYRDPTTTYKERRRISLVFEENPKPILKKFGWLSEDEELPYVANVVAVDSNGDPVEIRENMKILVVSELGLQNNRMFLVSKVTGNNIDPLTWICKLVPYRTKISLSAEEMKEEYQEPVNDTRFSRLKVEI